jgi:hypothetical protein
MQREVFKTPYDQYKDRNGQAFEIISVIDKPDSTHDEEVLPMYLIRFKTDRAVIEAWPEEVYNYED